MSKSGGKDTTTSKKWVSYFDVLRVLAALAVVFIHVSCKGWVREKVGSSEWWASNFWDGVMRWAVPIFVMISGALMLNPEKKFSIKKLYSKNILRIVIAFSIWSIIYILFDMFVMKKGFIGFVDVVKKFFAGAYHMWFLYMLIGLYVVTPILRIIVKHRTAMEYLLIIGIFLSVILPGIKTLCGGYLIVGDNKYVEMIFKSLESVLDLMSFKFVAGYVLYYILGYYLFSEEISKRMRMVFYALGICGLAVMVLYSGKVSALSGTAWDAFGAYMPWVLMPAMALFVFVKYHGEKLGQNKIVRTIAATSFGIYLVHALIIEYLLVYVWPDMHFGFWPIVGMTVLVFAVSFVITWVLKKIPFVRNYIA